MALAASNNTTVLKLLMAAILVLTGVVATLTMANKNLTDVLAAEHSLTH